jgi:PIN domain nuclease of toxin-antitoxin system
MHDRLLLDTYALLWLASALAHKADIVTGDRRFAKYGVKVLV